MYVCVYIIHRHISISLRNKLECFFLADSFTLSNKHKHSLEKMFCCFYYIFTTFCNRKRVNKRTSLPHTNKGLMALGRWRFIAWSKPFFKIFVEKKFSKFFFWIENRQQGLTYKNFFACNYIFMLIRMGVLSLESIQSLV